MKLFRYFAIASVVGLAFAASATTANAAGGPGCNGPFCNQTKYPTFGSYLQGQGLFGGLNKPKLPVFQAAPWYQYWPYDGHFMTPAPIAGGAFYGPPMTGNFPVNPYFPGAQGFGGYGGGFGFGPPMGNPLPAPMPVPNPK